MFKNILVHKSKVNPLMDPYPDDVVYSSHINWNNFYDGFTECFTVMVNRKGGRDLLPRSSRCRSGREPNSQERRKEMKNYKIIYTSSQSNTKVSRKGFVDYYGS